MGPCCKNRPRKSYILHLTTMTTMKTKASTVDLSEICKQHIASTGYIYKPAQIVLTIIYIYIYIYIYEKSCRLLLRVFYIQATRNNNLFIHKHLLCIKTRNNKSPLWATCPVAIQWSSEDADEGLSFTDFLRVMRFATPVSSLLDFRKRLVWLVYAQKLIP